MVISFVFLTVLFGVWLLVRPVTVLIHELGHAIPLILLTGKKAVVYIGSYGDPAKSLLLSTSYLDIWFRFNPFLWRSGLCRPTAEDISYTKQIIYTVCGPLASIAIASLAIYFAFRFDSHSALKYVLIVFFCSSLLDLLVNSIPNGTPTQLYSGNMVYNDGYQVRWLLQRKKLKKRYDRAISHVNSNELSKAADLLDDNLLRVFVHVSVLRLAVSVHAESGRFTKALELHHILCEKDQLTNLDYYYLGLIKNHLDTKEESLDAFRQSLALNLGNVDCLCNMGYMLNLYCEFEDAVKSFDAAIALNPQFAYAYSNRGLSKIKLNRADEGLEDVASSILIDPNNSYAYRNRGIYHMERGENTEAMRDFQKARELDKDTHLIDEFINSMPTAI